MTVRSRGVAFVLALSLGIGSTAYAAYIPAKAWLAQVLLEVAWTRQTRDGVAARPWPWADTTPVARIAQRRLGIDQIVLEGASGRVLAFGPGHITGTARPGELGNVVISAHRDTHFRWLKDVKQNDELELETASGGKRRYAVREASVHHESEVQLLAPGTGDQLRLITCYPFDALNPGTPWRFVVTAAPRPAPRSVLR